MKIDIKGIQELLYACNVNFYEMYVDTECECIDIELNEMIENIAIEELLKELKEIFEEIEFNDSDVIILYFNQ